MISMIVDLKHEKRYNFIIYRADWRTESLTTNANIKTAIGLVL